MGFPGAERDEALRGLTEALEAFRKEGIPAAMKIMIARSGVDFNDREPEVPPPAAQRFADLQHFLTCDVPAVARYQPDIAALAAVKSKIVPAAGANSPRTFPFRSVTALADIIGRPVVEFPGGHTGYVLRPKAFARKLEELFGAS